MYQFFSFLPIIVGNPVIQCIFPVKYVSLVIAQNNKHQTVFAVYGENGCTFFLRICLFQRIQIFDSCKLLKLLFLFSENKITGTEWEVNGQNINADLPVREVSVIWKYFLTQNFLSVFKILIVSKAGLWNSRRSAQLFI